MDVIDIEYSDDGVIFIVWFNIAFFDSIIHDLSSDDPVKPIQVQYARIINSFYFYSERVWDICQDSFLSEVYFIGETAVTPSIMDS